MFRVTKRAGNLRGIWLMNIFTRVTFQARRINHRRLRRRRVRKLLQIQNSRLRPQRDVHHAVRPRISRDVTRATVLIQMIRRRQRCKRRAGMWIGNSSGTDENIPPRRIAKNNQQHRARCGDDRERHAPAPNAQRRHGRTFGDRTAAASIRQRAGLAFAAGSRANPAAFGFALLGFQDRFALGSRAAMAFCVRPLAARIALTRVAANPIVIWPRVILRIEFRRWQLFAHRAPPENPKTKTMCSAVKISSP